jgi:hypothetical protein
VHVNDATASTLKPNICAILSRYNFQIENKVSDMIEAVVCMVNGMGYKLCL